MIGLFGSNNEVHKTNCAIKVTEDKSYYPSGQPDAPYDGDDLDCKGDGTVPTVSLELDGVVPTLKDDGPGHATLVSGFREDILTFLKKDRDLTSKSLTTMSKTLATTPLAAPFSTLRPPDLDTFTWRRVQAVTF